MKKIEKTFKDSVKESQNNIKSKEEEINLNNKIKNLESNFKLKNKDNNIEENAISIKNKSFRVNLNLNSLIEEYQ